MSTENGLILVVDDELGNRKLLEMLLKSRGYAAISVASGEEALAFIAQTPPDVILLDVVMAGMTGHELALALKADPVTTHIPIIMITAAGERAAKLLALDSGAEEFLTKPIDPAELWLRVRNLLRLKLLSDRLLDSGAAIEAEVQSRTNDLQLFRSAMDTTQDAILLVNRATMRFIEVNSTGCAMFGYSRAEMLQMGPEDVSAGPGNDFQQLYEGIIDAEKSSDVVERLVRHNDGSIIQVEVQRHIMRSGGDYIVVTVLRDITVRKQVEQRLHQLAHYDMLTGLPNRALFYETLARSSTKAAEQRWEMAVLFIDLDRFKAVNDMLGHDAGDLLLRLFGDRMVECVRIRDTIGRLGGDEFAIILVGEDAKQAAASVVGKIREALRTPFNLNGSMISMSASVGISVYPDDARDAGALVKFADTAMYRAKQAGGDASRFFTAAMNIELLARIELEAALRGAIEHQEFVLHYQAKRDLGSGLIVGVEALLRWERPGHGLIAPGSFIQLLEDTGLIVTVGRWVIDTACRQIAAWSQSAIGPMPVSINVSARQFVDGDLDREIADALQRNGIAGHLLDLELTETTLMANTERTLVTLRNLKARGVKISIDDFGTGYSSLAYLRRFTIDNLKIDGSFVNEMTSNADDAAIVTAIIGLAHSLRMLVIAEGVETIEQVNFLRDNGCDVIQGYHAGRPAALAGVEDQIMRPAPLTVELRSPAAVRRPRQFGKSEYYPASTMHIRPKHPSARR